MCLLRGYQGASMNYHPSTPCPHCNEMGGNNSLGAINTSNIHIDEGDDRYYNFCPNCGFEEPFS